MEMIKLCWDQHTVTCKTTLKVQLQANGKAISKQSSLQQRQCFH